MNKLVIGLFLMSVLFLTACSSSNDSEKGNVDTKNSENAETDSKSKEDQSVGVDKGIFNVEVTLPAAYFEGEDIDKAIADAKAEGIKEASKNPDGSVTYKMSKEKHKEMMIELEESVKEYINELQTSEEYPSIREVTANGNNTKYTLIVDKAGYENGFEGFATIGLGMLGMYYQVFDGVDSENAKVEVIVIDETTDEIFDTTVYPDDMKEE